MWDQCPLEVLKLAASILTPLVIAVVGLIINKTIQRQNAMVQRKSSWLEKWADDFLKAASAFNESAKKLARMGGNSELTWSHGGTEVTDG